MKPRRPEPNWGAIPLSYLLAFAALRPPRGSRVGTDPWVSPRWATESWGKTKPRRETRECRLGGEQPSGCSAPHNPLPLFPRAGGSISPPHLRVPAASRLEATPCRSGGARRFPPAGSPYPPQLRPGAAPPPAREPRRRAARRAPQHERRVQQLPQRRQGAGERVQLPADGRRRPRRVLLRLPGHQVLLRWPAQLLPLRAQLHVVAQVGERRCRPVPVLHGGRWGGSAGRETRVRPSLPAGLRFGGTRSRELHAAFVPLRVAAELQLLPRETCAGVVSERNNSWSLQGSAGERSVPVSRASRVSLHHFCVRGTALAGPECVRCCRA